MNMVRAAAVCVLAALLCALLPRREMRLGVVLAAGLGVMLMCLEPLREGAQTLYNLGVQGGADENGVMIRAVGVAMLSEFGAQLCRDAGEGTLAGRVELAGRAAMLTLALPLLNDLIKTLGNMLP